MPRFNIDYSCKYKISPNYVPRGMHEGQIYTVEGQFTVRARNEKHARKIAFEGWKPENEWEFDRTILAVTLNDRSIVT